MRTTLNLLTRDGVVFMAFEPALSAAQYGRLLEIAKRAATQEELQTSVEAWARAEKLRISFDEIKSPL